MRTQGRAGFTLFETVLAAAILSLVMLGVLAGVNNSFLADKAAAGATSSQTIARRIMEECLAVAYDDLLNLNGNTTTVDGFTTRVTVIQSATDLRLIEVTVDRPGATSSSTRLLMLRSAR